MAIKQVVKKDLKEFFPKEFSNRRLIGKFIDYVMNNFFQTSSEEYINGYVGKKSVALEEGDFYIKENSSERQVYQLTPALISKDAITGENKAIVEYCNFINTLKLQGCDINDQNRLLSNEYWSWCPPINIDMFLNYNFYYWIEEGQDPIEIAGRTNIILDILGKEYYTYINEENSDDRVEFLSGLRVKFLNDENPEYNNKVYIVEGVGKSIELIEDDNILYSKNIEPDYYVMERGCVDGNSWSLRNRWFHRSVISKMTATETKKYKQAKKPIICFNKDIQLYNYGTYNRGYVDLYVEAKKSSIHGVAPQPIQGVELKDGMTILITGDDNVENNNKIYQISGVSSINTVILQPIINGLSASGEAVDGEGINIRLGRYAGQYFYFKDGQWINGQQKNNINQSPLFKLFDDNKVELDNNLIYPQSSFKGSKLFDYVETDAENAVYDEDLGKYILTDGYGNYKFNNLLDSESFTYNYYDTIKTYTGFKFFKLNGSDTYLNTWYLSKDITSQYITTEITVTDIREYKEIEEESGLKTKYTVYKLAYQPDVSNIRKSSFVYLNGTLLNEKIDYLIQDKQLLLTENISLKVDDNLYIKLLVKKLDSEIAENYFYDLPLSLTANAMNGNITEINYSECFDQLKSIIENQSNFEGEGGGYNNYNNTKKDLSLGTEILQHSNPILKTMLLNSQQYTNIRNILEFISNEYSKFKNKFKTVITTMSNNGEYTEESDVVKIVMEALNRINLGKEGLNAFYNNGVASEFGETYIPATPAYLGIDNCYKPEIITLDNQNKSTVLLCHDGSYTQLFNDYRDNALLRMEQAIYDSIPLKWKTTLPVYNKYKNIPGKFRKTDYSLTEYKDFSVPFLEKWCNDNNYDYTDHSNFDYTDPFTWNYSTCIDADGEQLYGSYRSIYLYYYDTYRPHTHPWEMLGFGSKPDWWESYYGKAPYNSSNIPMWKDIENGYIADGENKGIHEEFKRPNLVEKYLPVDENGNLLNPIQIGIVTKAPIAFYASQPWVAGDMGSVETAWTFTSEYRYNLQTIMYLMRPIEWVEHNWDTLNRITLFKGTDYEQTIYENTINRPSPSEIYVHNEVIDGVYLKNIGIQQWISDFLTNENISITDYAGSMIRNIDMVLSYRCGRYFKKDSLKIISDNYGVLPSQNYHIDLYKSQTNKQSVYSAMLITKVENGYMLDGYNLSDPYFNVFEPILTGKKTNVEINNKNVIYYNNWKTDGDNNVRRVKYKTIFTSVQELFNIICGYGKYLEEIEGWVFNKVLSSSGTLIDFNTKAEDFVKWVTLNPTNGQLIILNPGFEGLTIMHDAFLDTVGQYINGYWTVLDTNGNPIYNNELDVYRHNGYSDIMSKVKVLTTLKTNIVENEHIILFDNKTLYGDILYDPMLCIKAQRLKIIGTAVSDWDGTFYAPGYLIDSDGAVPNYDKLAEDFKYFFDTDDVRAQGIFGDYAKKTIGFQKLPNMERLLIDDRNIFDFYKGMLKEKGTRRSFGKLNRSNYIMNNNSSQIDLYENWAFKLGEFGYTSDNYLMEFKINAKDITQDPQIISFTTSDTPNNDNSIIEICWNDKNWLKKLANKEDNTFLFNNNTKFNPVGGFARIEDVNYIVANDEEFEKVQENIKLNETIWVVKTSNKNWDILKKVEDGFMSMRVNNISQLKTFDTSKLVKNDLVYVSADILNNHLDYVKDPENLMRKGQYIVDSIAWSIFKYNGEEFELYRIQNKVVDLTKFNDCFMINDDTNETLSKIHLYDPIQGIIPNKVLDEVNYITSIDPVFDYNDFYKWGDDKVGYLWWDISKVRYLDYHQGDIYYRRKNWGKQLPGSEIAVYEWYKSNKKPDDNTVKYVTKELYNYETSTYDTYYYYWIKNPSDIPDVDFRHISALTISQTINSPQDEGIIWFAPLYIGTGDYKYSSFIIGNFDNVSTGNDFVIQFNFKNAVDMDEHVEWVLVREGDDDRIPESLWNKMKYSLIGYDSLGNVIPDPSLDDRNKIGILIRPRQTMFKSLENSRRNFVDVVNDIFDTRDVMTSTDVGTTEFNKTFLDSDPYPESDFEPFESYYDMQQNKDSNLIGKKLLVEHDENYDGIWTLWEMTAIGKFKLLQYQTYDVKKYWYYKDLYKDVKASMEQPLRIFETEVELNDYFYNNTVEKGSIYKVYNREGKWELIEFTGMQGTVPTFNKIGMQDGTINLTDGLYEFLSNKSIVNDTSKFIGDITKYEYLMNETSIIIDKIISYFEK